MGEVVHIEDGIDYGLLMGGLAVAVDAYRTSVADDELEELMSEGGPSRDCMARLLGANPHVIVPDALLLTEDVGLIAQTESFRKEAAKWNHSDDMGYALSDAVGRAVAKNLHAVINSVEARDMLPDKTVAMIEVNVNRGFAVGREDAAGCYGIPQNFLGHVGIDAYFMGERSLRTRKEQKRVIDHQLEMSRWEPNGLPRDAARIRVRPSYPLVKASLVGPYPEESFAYWSGNSSNGLVLRPYYAFRGEYNISRAVAVLHDPRDWVMEDFESTIDVVQRLDS